MNNKNEYLELIYTPDGYKIFAVTETQKVKFNATNAKILFNILKNKKYIQIDEDVYRFTDLNPIYKEFKQETKKYNNKKYVNRQKSKSIVTGTIPKSVIIAAAGGLIVGGIFVGGLAYFNHINNNNNINSNNKETIIQVEPTTIVTTPTVSLVPNQDNNEENIQINNSANDNYNDNYIENFHYYYTEIDDKQALENAKKYDEIFLKYEKKYGIDKDLLRAIAARESSGKQNITNNGKSYGLMAIENIWADQTIEVYNFETQKYETIKVDYEKVKNDADYNIMLGSAIMQWHFNATIKSGLINKNEALAYSLQRYNMGPKALQDILKTGVHWMEGRKEETQGDKEYFEKVLTNIENGDIIKMRLIDGTYHYYSITNDALELESVHTKG